MQPLRSFPFDIAHLPIEQRRAAVALWNEAPHPSIAVPVDVSHDLSSASFERADATLGELPHEEVCRAFWLLDIVDAIRAAQRFGFWNWSSLEIDAGRPSIILGMGSHSSALSSRDLARGLVHHLVRDRPYDLGGPHHLAAAVAAVAFDDTSDLDALSAALRTYLQSDDARAAARAGVFAQLIGSMTSKDVWGEVTARPYLLFWDDIREILARRFGQELVAAIGANEFFVRGLLRRLPELAHQLIAIVGDADKPLLERVAAAEILGRQRSREAVPALLRALQEPEPLLFIRVVHALARIPGERGVLVDDERQRVTPCSHDFASLMPMEDEARRFCADCNATVTPVRALQHGPVLVGVGRSLSGALAVRDARSDKVYMLRPGDSVGSDIVGMSEAEIVNAGERRLVFINALATKMLDATRQSIDFGELRFAWSNTMDADVVVTRP